MSSSTITTTNSLRHARRTILPTNFQTAATTTTRLSVATTTTATAQNEREVHRGRRGGRNNYHYDHSSMGTSTRLVLMLLEACPQAVSVRTKTGFKTKTPFHIACEANVDYVVLRAMLSINPALAVQPFNNSHNTYGHCDTEENPLQLLWKNNHLLPDGNRGVVKEKMALLLQAAHMGAVLVEYADADADADAACEDNFVLLNAACSVKCPRDYWALVLEEEADQIARLDEHGLLPLHYAVRNATAENKSYTQFVVNALLKTFPQAAAVTDESGRLPLHVACSIGLTWHKGGVQELTLGNTDALRTVDPLTKLVPFLQSAEHAISSRLHLSTTFELLLAAPEMVQPWKVTQSAACNNDWGHSRR
eukprot:CAMPEP_0198139994 /NCGR_PEP_ID=MMETSP1443-20131203/3232_1 /TAXON_ID=186043 /ORGANISM="Entomoneis sp., Strain CCMP2396" /LENGTH=363 /DNA_ID=CAMNT_0043802295 /DNA_START=351 /DNA_END=1442 /DNA_ORIENTATION=+